MEVKKLSIANKVILSAIETDKFKSGIITFTLSMPLEQDSYANSLLLAGVLRRGTEKFPKMADINRRLDELYASCVEIRSNIIGNYLSVIYTAEFLDDRYIGSTDEVFVGILEVISQLLLSPRLVNGVFDKDILAQEVKCAKDAINAEINNTRSYASTRCNELMNRNNNNYPTIDKLLEQIEKIDESSLYEYYKQLIERSFLEIFYIGTENIDSVKEKILSAFPCFSHFNGDRSEQTRFSCSDFVAQSKSMPVSQGKLALGFDTGVTIHSKEYYSALLFNEILGGSAASKLFLNVREKMNICYYCSSSYSVYSGKMLISSGIDTSNKDIAKNAILEQISDIKNGKITDTEFSAAKKSLINCYRQIYDNPLEIQAFFGGRSLFEIGETIDECIENIMSVDLKGVVAVANNTRIIAEFFVEGNASDTSSMEEEEVYEE